MLKSTKTVWSAGKKEVIFMIKKIVYVAMAALMTTAAVVTPVASVKAAEVKTEAITRGTTIESFRFNAAPGYQRVATVVNRGNSDLEIWLTEASASNVMFILANENGTFYMGSKASVPLGGNNTIKFPTGVGTSTFVLYAFNALSTWQTFAGSYSY